jgi:hypothetical protein
MSASTCPDPTEGNWSASSTNALPEGNKRGLGDHVINFTGLIILYMDDLF